MREVSLILIIHKEARTCVTGRAGRPVEGPSVMPPRHECFCTLDAPNRPNLRVKALRRFPRASSSYPAPLLASSRRQRERTGPAKNFNSSKNGPTFRSYFTSEPILDLHVSAFGRSVLTPRSFGLTKMPKLLTGYRVFISRTSRLHNS